MASIFDNLGQGLQDAGSILSPDVAQRQAQQRQLILRSQLATAMQNRQLAARAIIAGVQSGSIDPKLGQAKLAELGLGNVPVGPSLEAQGTKAFMDWAGGGQPGGQPAGMSPQPGMGMPASPSGPSASPIPPAALASPLAGRYINLLNQERLLNKPTDRPIPGTNKFLRTYPDGRHEVLDTGVAQAPKLTINPSQYTPSSLKAYSASGNIGDLVPLKSTQEGQPVDKYGPVTNLEVKDATGKVSNIMAQQDKRTGAWVSADEKRKPIDVSNGFKPVKDTALGSREATLLQRGIVSAADAVSDITNMSLLPVKSNTGIFGMGHEVVSPSIFEAPKRALLNQMTSQDAQSMQVAIKGVGRALAGLATGGVYVNQAIIRQYDMLAPQPGDTYLTKLQKLATMRQNADNGIDSILTNPRIGEDQKKMLEQLKEALKQAVPYTPAQVINYMKQGKDDETFDQYYARTAGKGQPKKSGDLPPGFVEDKADRIPQ